VGGAGAVAGAGATAAAQGGPARPPAAGGGHGVAHVAAGGPLVQSMIVGGGGGLLWADHTVAATAATLRVGGRACAVAAGTPLAVLAAARRAGGPGFALRDYGHCGNSAANSGQLFVYFIGGQRNRGQDGWEYKVNGRAGSTGAGDPSGPQGDGRRIRPGSRVLWFWCETGARGCQHSLEVSAPTTVGRGGSLTVTVTGYDDQGEGFTVGGATVTLGSHAAVTGSHGRATVTVPSRGGRYALTASKPGLVPSFPETIVVR
jgi:hypothetical protein